MSFVQGTIRPSADGDWHEVFEGGHWRKLNVLPMEKLHQTVRNKLQALPKAEDVIPLVDPSSYSQYYDVSLEEYSDHINLDQDGVGSCAWESTAYAVMITRWQQTGELVLLNPWTGYGQTNNSDVGSDTSENFEKAQEVGLVADVDWPRELHSWRSLPPNLKELAAKNRIDQVFRVSTKQEVISCVGGLRIPVVIGVNWSGGGHAIMVVRCMAKGALIKNSWGKTWDGGYTKPTYKVLPWSQVEQGLEIFTSMACCATRIV